MTTKQKLLSTLTALGMIAGIANAHGQILQAISLNFYEQGSNNHTLEATDATGVLSLTNWNNLAGPQSDNSTGTTWTGLVDSTGASIAGLTVQAHNISPGAPTTAYTGVTRWKDLPETPHNVDEKMIGAGVGVWANNASFTISVSDLPSAFSENEVNVYIYWGGKFGSSADADEVTTNYTIGTQTESLTFGNNLNNWAVAHDREFVLEGNYLVFENITLTNGGFDLDLAIGSSRRIGISGMQIVAIPEPGTLVLVGIALGSLLLFRRKK